MFRNMKIRTRLTVTILCVTLGTLLLVYLGFFAITLNLRASVSELYREIAGNAERSTEDALLAQAEDALGNIVRVQTEATDSRLETISKLVGVSADAVTVLYQNPEDYTESPYEVIPLKDTVEGELCASYFLCGDTAMTEDIRRELTLISFAEKTFSPIMEYSSMVVDLYLGTESNIFYRYTALGDYDPDYMVTQRPWYQKAMEHPGEIVWLETYIDPMGKACITAARTVAGPDGEIVGVIGADVSFSGVVEEIVADGLGTSGTSFLLGEDYDLIASRDIYDEHFDPAMEAHFDNPDAVRESLQSGSDKAFFATLDGEEYYMLGQKIPETGWTFCAAVNRAEVVTPIQEVQSETEEILSGASDRMIGAFRHIILNILISFLVIGAVISVIGWFLSRSLTGPLDRLKAQTAQIGEGHFDVKIEPENNDEIGELAVKFNDMQDSLKRYTENLQAATAEKERIGAELSVATNIQSSMLPCIFPAFPEIPQVDVYATMEPAREVGGDFYDFFMVDKYHLAVVVADVSGKGVPAALFMVIGKTLIKDHTVPGEDLGTVFTDVNTILCESNSEELFITAFEAVLDMRTGEVRYVNAGHEHPFQLETCDGGIRTYTELKPKAGMVLAGMDGIRYRAGAFAMQPGERLFLYTDGVTDATNASQELYGMKRLTGFLNAHTDLHPMELLPALRADIDTFVDGVEQFDDITMLCLEYVEPMEETPERQM